MELVTLSNGKTECITSIDYAFEVVDKHLGTDLARYIEQMHNEQINELQNEMSDMYTEDDACTKFGEPKERALFSARNALDEIIEYLNNAKRINREKLSNRLSSLRKEIDSEL